MHCRLTPVPLPRPIMCLRDPRSRPLWHALHSSKIARARHNFTAPHKSQHHIMRPVVTVPPYINQVDRGPPTTCPAPLQVGPSGGRAGSLSDCARVVVWVPALQRWLCSHFLGPGLLADRPLPASPRRHAATWSHAAPSPHHPRTSGGENSLSAYAVESPWPLRTRLPSTTLSSALPLSSRR